MARSWAALLRLPCPAYRKIRTRCHCTAVSRAITLPDEQVHVAKGVTLRRGLFDTFSTPMMGFKDPGAGGHTPGPWVAVDGAYHSFQSRAELAIENLR